MQFKRILGLVLVLSLSFVLTACGGGAATPAPEATTASDTDSDTDADADSTAEADTDADADAGDLGETATATDATGGTITVNYPSGWTAQEMTGAGTIVLTGSEAGQAVTVTFLNSTMATALGDSPSAILSTQSDALVGAMTGATVGDVTETTVDGNPAASRTVSMAGVDTVYYVVSTEGGYAFVYGVGVDAATVEAIAASVAYSS
jgi:hypothetical protein